MRRPGRFALALVALAAASATATARAQDRDPRELEAKKACLGGRTDRGIELLAEMYAETNDPTLMAKWALECLFEMDVRPVITDEQAGPLMAQIGKQ